MRMHAGESRRLKKRQINTTTPFVVLQDKLKQLSTDFGRLAGEASTFRSVAAEMRTLSDEVSGLKEQLGADLCGSAAQQLSTEFGELQKVVSALKTQIAELPPPSPAPVPPSPQQSPVPSAPLLDSRIISDFPEIFAEFRKFSLLWRGSRDGFKAQELHRRCDGHANTLTVILDTKGEHLRRVYARGVGIAGVEQEVRA
jgi:hypothetical protein